MTPAPHREVSAEELPGLLAGTAVVLAVPTPIETEPFLAELRDLEPFRAATKPFWRARLAGRSGASAAPVVLMTTGYDKANVAHGLTCLLQAVRPRLVVLAGIAGVFWGSGLRPGDLVLVDREIYADTGASSPEGWLSTEALSLPLAEVDGQPLWNEVPVTAGFLDQARDALAAVDWRTLGPEAVPPQIAVGPAVTVSRTTGTAAEALELEERWRPLAESMEGAAAAHVCLLYGVPFLEVRGASNIVGPRERDSWRLDLAVERAARGALAIAEEFLGGTADGAGYDRGASGSVDAEGFGPSGDDRGSAGSAGPGEPRR